MEKIELNIQPNGDALTIRSGTAPNVYDPVQIALSGTITAPGDFAERRKTEFKPLDSHVVADYTKRTITLIANASDHFFTKVEGSLKLHPELEGLFVNASKMFSHRELYALLKFKGAFFKDRQAHVDLLEKLKKFEAKVGVEFTDANNFKGAQAYTKVVAIKTNLDLQFTLSVPLFTGAERSQFAVEINVDIEGAGVKFWLESVELNEAITTQTESIFEHELARLSDYVIVKTYS